MPLSVGDKLGPYEIVAPIGAGGMGEVYRARDTKLGREVAIKVLPAAFAQHPERLARFEREAKVLASLNDPNIAQIYGLEESGAGRALVMELVQGETLQGVLPVDTALKYAAQIASALDAAHEKGIIHRDLKPANIMLTPDGVVKVLDFGLATVTQPSGESQADPNHSATLTMGATQAGTIMGTAGYMAPEQARGKPVDKRADIWAFGVVLYELITGERPFKGDDIADILASVVKEQPDITRAPPHVRRLLASCLEKDPKRRLRDIGDWARQLDDATVPAVAPSPSRAGRWWPATGAVLAIVAVALGFLYFRERPAPPATVVRFQFPAPQEAGVGVPIVSPDGKKAIIWSSTQISVRSFDSLEARPLASTEGTFVETPFWTADSRFLVYAAAGMLKKVEASGGPPVALCELPGVNALSGGFSLADGRILFAQGTGGFREVASGGGTSSPLQIPGTATGTSPALLPDGEHFIFSGSAGIYAASLNGRESAKRLLPDRSRAAYVPSSAGDSGYLVFQRGETLLAQPFNPKRLEVAGDPVAIAQPGSGFSGSVSGFSASVSGALVYRAGFDQSKLTWFDRAGKPVGTAWAPGAYTELAISPDGSRMAVVRSDNPPTAWIHEFATETSTRLASPGFAAVKPVWSPESKDVAFFGLRAAGAPGLFEESWNGAGKEQPLFSKPEGVIWPWDWSRDGHWLLISVVDPKTKEDLWVLPMQGEHKPEPFLVTDYTETAGAFSPDGRFIAYVSDESGKFEVYVRSFPAASGGKWAISSGGGYQPRWRPDGKELFYFAAEGKLMSVDVTPGTAFKAGAPKFLFQAPIFGGGASTENRYWDVNPDGKRFLINVAGGGSAPVTVVLNWQAGLKK
jgi:eukaryotic-like serine/threonine-protein kinase